MFNSEASATIKKLIHDINDSNVNIDSIVFNMLQMVHSEKNVDLKNIERLQKYLDIHFSKWNELKPLIISLDKLNKE